MRSNWGRRAAAVAVAALLVCSFTGPLGADGTETSPPSVVASIRPIHSLVAGVMEGVGAPTLLMAGSPAPDTVFDADRRETVEQADVIVWVGPSLEKSLERVMVSSGRDLIDIPLIDAPGVRLMDIRPPGEAEAQNTGAAQRARRRQVSSRDVLPDRPDPRIWLSPRNAVAMVRTIAETLARVDPAHAARYRRNELTMTIGLETLDGEVEAILAPVRGRHYATLGNSFQYFERNYVLRPRFRLDLRNVGESANEEISAWRQRIADGSIRCVVRAASSDGYLAGRLVHRTRARVETVDLYGRGFAPGADAYFALIRHVAGRFSACLTPRAD